MEDVTREHITPAEGAVIVELVGLDELYTGSLLELPKNEFANISKHLGKNNYVGKIVKQGSHPQHPDVAVNTSILPTDTYAIFNKLAGYILPIDPKQEKFLKLLYMTEISATTPDKYLNSYTDIVPNGNRVLVKVVDTIMDEKSGLYLGEKPKDKLHADVTMGEIVGVGTTVNDPTYTVGTKIGFDPYAGNIVWTDETPTARTSVRTMYVHDIYFILNK
jgi:co-chaperonin GroES (HSP10)